MSLGTWEDILNDYPIYLNSPRTSKHAQAMIDIIPILSQNDFLSTLTVGISHAVFILKVPDKKTFICVWYEDEEFSIYYSDPIKEKEGKNIKVKSTELETKLIEYANKLIVDSEWS